MKKHFGIFVSLLGSLGVATSTYAGNAPEKAVENFIEGNQPGTPPPAPCPGCPPIDLKLKPAVPDNTRVAHPRAMDTKVRYKPAPVPLPSPTPTATEVIQYKKGPEDKSCQLMLGWGHTYMGRGEIQRREISGIGQGCNEGRCGVGELEFKEEYWRYQSGTNGLYANDRYQGTQNSGLNPLILENLRHSEHPVTVKNSRIGFMRMTQYHWLKLHEYALTKVKNRDCSAVSIEFKCAARDMTDHELRSRLNAYQKETSYFGNLKDLNISEEDRSVLNRIRPLGTCFNDEKSTSLPRSCGEKVVVKAGLEILSKCKDWLKMIDQRPEHNEKTPKRLPKSDQEKFNADGPIY